MEVIVNVKKIEKNLKSQVIIIIALKYNFYIVFKDIDKMVGNLIR